MIRDRIPTAGSERFRHGSEQVSLAKCVDEATDRPQIAGISGERSMITTVPL